MLEVLINVPRLWMLQAKITSSNYCSFLMVSFINELKNALTSTKQFLAGNYRVLTPFLYGAFYHCTTVIL